MPVTLANFMLARGNALVLTSDDTGKAIEVVDRATFRDRSVRLVAEKPYGLVPRTEQHRQNAAAKDAFLCAIYDVYGGETVELVEKTIFPRGWSSSETPLSDMDVAVAVDSAVRINASGPRGANIIATENFIRGPLGAQGPSPLATIFTEMRDRLAPLGAWHLVEMDDLDELFRDAIFNDHRFVHERIGFNDFRAVARDIIARYNVAGG